MSRTIQSFHVRLFKSNEEGKPAPYPIFDKHGTASDERPQYIAVDGFSKDEYIDLQPYWDNIIHQGIRHYQTVITIRETIVKFGDTMQLVSHYLLTFEVHYA